MASKLEQTLQSFVDISPDEMVVMNQLVGHRLLKKKDLILKQGEICKELIFLETGCARSFYTKKSKDITSYVYFEGSFISIMQSFLGQEPSKLSYEAVEDCELFVLHFDDLQKLYQSSLKFERIGRLMVEKLLIEAEERLSSFILESPEERYLHLIAGNPNLVRKIPQHYLASMLGITPISLSRIRSRIFSETATSRKN